jgi:hypothetical protein
MRSAWLGTSNYIKSLILRFSSDVRPKKHQIKNLKLSYTKICDFSASHNFDNCKLNCLYENWPEVITEAGLRRRPNLRSSIGSRHYRFTRSVKCSKSHRIVEGCSCFMIPY